MTLRALSALLLLSACSTAPCSDPPSTTQTAVSQGVVFSKTFTSSLVAGGDALYALSITQAPFTLSKIDDNAAAVWSKSITVTATQSNSNIALVSAGSTGVLLGLVATGVTVEGFAKTPEVPTLVLAQFDTAGKANWVKSFAIAPAKFALATNASGNIALTFNAKGNADVGLGATSCGHVIAVLAADGTPTAQRCVLSNAPPDSKAAVINDNGEVFASFFPPNGSFDVGLGAQELDADGGGAVLVKYSAKLAPLWAVNFQNAYADTYAPLPDGGLMVVGGVPKRQPKTYSNEVLQLCDDKGETHTHVTRIAADGKTRLVRTFGDHRPRSLQRTAAGHFYSFGGAITEASFGYGALTVPADAEHKAAVLLLSEDGALVSFDATAAPLESVAVVGNAAYGVDGFTLQPLKLFKLETK